jgi:hypothetical protein
MAKEKKDQEEQAQEDEVLTTTDSNKVVDSTGVATEPDPAPTKDEEINAIGADAPVVTPPVLKEVTVAELLAFTKYLAARTMSGPEYASAKQVFPKILRD